MIIYINGIKASKKDLERLAADILQGKTNAKTHRTKRGYLAIITD